MKNTIKVISSMMAITLIGKVMGMLRDVLFAANYGTTSIEANAFLTASRIPRLFFDAMFASAISSSFIPIFNEYLKKKGKKEAYNFSSNFISIVFLITAILSILGSMLAKPIVNIIAGGFDEPTSILCVKLLIILFPMLIFTGVAYSFTGILQSLDEFTIPATMSIVSNGIIIFYILVLDKNYGVFGLAFTYLIGWFMQAVIQVPPLIKKEYRYKFRINFKDEGVKKVGLLMLPVMVSTWIQPINIAINTKFASNLSGGVASLEYANNLYTIIAGVFVLSVANVIFPQLSKLTADNNSNQFATTLGTTLKSVFFLLIPMMVGLIILANPIVKLVYERGQFSAESTRTTAIALKYFSLGMLGFGMQNILSRGFYAIQDGKTPLITGTISIISNLILSIVLVKYMQIGGLALASSISSLLSGIMLLIPMQKKLGTIVTKSVIMDIIKMLVSALAMAIIVFYSKLFLTSVLATTFINQVIVLTISVTLGICVYLLLTYIMKLDETKVAVGLVKKFISKRRS